MLQDLFDQINNAVLDLQNSQSQTFERPLKKLAQLVRHNDLEANNTELTKDVDLESFIEQSVKTGGSMVGSSYLAWPDDQKKTMGLILLLIDKLANDTSFAINFSHEFFYSGKKIISSIHSLTEQMIIPFIRDYKAYIQSNWRREKMLSSSLSKKIFIVHGHDNFARETVARFVDNIGLVPIILHEQANQGRTIIEKIVANNDVGFAIVLLTPDDLGCKKGETPEPRVRQNVLLELGYFIGYLGRDKVCSLQVGAVEIPTDFLGVCWHPLDENGGWKQALGNELQAAGYDIDWNKVMRMS